MLCFRQTQNCEGDYYNTRTGEILRNVGPGQTRCCWEGAWDETAATGEPDAPQFEPLTKDVLAPIQAVLQEAACRYGGNATGRVLNRRTARQPEGGMAAEDAVGLASDDLPESEKCRGSI